MILPLDQSHVAFGLDWRVLLSGGKPDGLARRERSPLLWADPGGQYLGLLPAGENAPRRGVTVYAGAQLVLRCTTEPNVAYVAEIPDTGRYLAVCIHQRRPRKGFDRVGLAAQEVRELLDRFAEVCGHQPMAVYGDAHLEDLQHLPLRALLQAADPSAAMRRVQLLLRPLHAAAVAVCVVAVAVGAYVYRDWQLRQQAQQAAMSLPSADDCYAQALAALAAQPVMPAAALGGFVDWARALPSYVGGWRIKGADCQVAGAQSLSCELKLERGFAQATNASFLAAAPTAWQRGVVFEPDQKSARVPVVLSVPTQPLRTVLEQAPRTEVLPAQFTPLLQAMAVLGTEPRLEPARPFGVPAGLDVGQLRADLYRESQWTVQLPLRSAPRLARLPPYASVRSIGLALDTAPKATSADSFAIVKVAGAVLTH